MSSIDDVLTSDGSSEEGGDEFVRLIIVNQPRIYAYIVSLVPNWADADDLFQECSIVLWSKRDEFQPGTNFMAWACQIALNKVFNLRKRQARSKLTFSPEFLTAVSDERHGASDQLEHRAASLAACVEKLKPRDRDLLERWYQRRGTTKGLAEQLGRPIDTVYKAMKRIRMTLFECMTRSSAGAEARGTT